MPEHLLVGPHAVLEAFRAGRRKIERVFLARGRPDPRVAEIIQLAKVKGVPVTRGQQSHMDLLAKGLAHQGILAVVREASYRDPFELAAGIKGAVTMPLLVLLDGIQDPQNLGAIIRSGEAAGADGLFISKHRAAGITSAVARASAGAVEYLPVAQVAGFSAFLEWLKLQGIWILGADPGGRRSLYDIDLCVPLALVIGNEHRGLRALVRERCDLVASIPMRGRVGSLNAAASAAVFLFEIQRQRANRTFREANRSKNSNRREKVISE